MNLSAVFYRVNHASFLSALIQGGWSGTSGIQWPRFPDAVQSVWDGALTPPTRYIINNILNITYNNGR